MRTLTIVAGTNGAGKSKFSNYLKNLNLVDKKIEVVNIDGLEKYIDESKIPFDFLRYYREGLHNLDNNYQFFNEVYMFDNSVDADTNSDEMFTFLLHIQADEFKHVSPQFLKKENIAEKLPKIYNAITTTDNNTLYSNTKTL